MKKVFAQIEREKEKLARHDLMKWMSTTSQPLSFAPAMTFFVLGFRDVLSYLKRPKPESVWDHMINIHCDEDANHWIWFIEDLQKIGVSETAWGTDFSQLLQTMWSEEGQKSRDMVYSLIHFVKQNQDPFVNLALVETLEAAFAVFISTLMPQIEKFGWQNDLRYFGSRHHDDESNHAMGSWVGELEVDSSLEEVELNDVQAIESDKVVRELFSKFNDLFSSWYAQKDKFENLSLVSPTRRRNQEAFSN